MNFTLSADWRNAAGEQVSLSTRDFALLEAVLLAGSMKGAAQLLGVSYRTLWAQVQSLNTRYGEDLIATSNASGAYLTEAARNLRWMMELGRARLKTDLLRLNEHLNAEWSDEHLDLPWLSMALSDDPLLQEWLNTTKVHHEINLALSWQGSIAALSSFHRQESRIAGCHLPVGEGRNSEVHQMMRRWLRGDNLVVLELFDREIGWLSRPDRIVTLEDVRNKTARLVNRNSASSTHHQLNALITRACLNPQDLPGYEEEEHSHLAVACRIAAAQADLGLGISQVARQYGLNFRPVSRDRYFLVFRRSDLNSAPVQIVLKLFASVAFERVLSAREGYTPLSRSPKGLEDFLMNLP